MKRFALLLLWLAGVGLATGVAWAGVSVVENQVIDPAPAVRQAASPTAALESDRAVQTSTSASVAPTTVGPTPSSSSTGEAAPSVDQTTSTTTLSTTGPSTSESDLTSTSSTSSLPPSSTSATTTTSGAAPATTQTFTLIGGTTAISFSAGVVEVLWATPQPGFDVRIDPESPGMKVEFRAEHHRSRVDVWWSDGPQHVIDEDDRN